MVIRGNGEQSNDEEFIRLELSTRLSANWHYVTIQRSKTSLKVYVDDMFTEEMKTNDISDLIVSFNLKI